MQNQKAKVKVGGFIKIDEFKILEQPSFVEFLKSGWFINLSVAIDFTASNGTRHNIKDNMFNEYELALQEVGKILEPYAYKKKFAGFGFGGIPTHLAHQTVSHCFNLNGSQDPTIVGKDNLLQAYRKAAGRTTLWGPTYFSKVLDMVQKYMHVNLQNKIYHILLILTDGCIHDLRETIDLIV